MEGLSDRPQTPSDENCFERNENVKKNAPSTDRPEAHSV